MCDRILIYCQHSLGLGHLIRTLSIAEFLSDSFDVTLLNGGTWPSTLSPPSSMRIVDLPALRSNAEGRLESADSNRTVRETFDLRAERLLQVAHQQTPSILLVELYPFGRKKFSPEIDQLIGACEKHDAKIICSVRDILVRNRQDQQAFDDRACTILSAAFDAILVHGDPEIASLEDSFRPSTPLECPVHYTGYIDRPGANSGSPDVREPRVVVSAGGGRFASRLRRLALEAAPLLQARASLAMTIVAGPFVTDSEWSDLTRQSLNTEQFDLIRQVSDLRPLLRRASVSVSQCGYNTMVDILATGTPALFVPFEDSGEDEQLRRARKLESRGIAALERLSDLSPDGFCDGVMRVLDQPPAHKIDLGGGAETVRLLREYGSSPPRAAEVSP